LACLPLLSLYLLYSAISGAWWCTQHLNAGSMGMLLSGDLSSGA
jgi:hypothetical protein